MTIKELYTYNKFSILLINASAFTIVYFKKELFKFTVTFATKAKRIMLYAIEQKNNITSCYRNMLYTSLTSYDNNSK